MSGPKVCALAAAMALIYPLLAAADAPAPLAQQPVPATPAATGAESAPDLAPPDQAAPAPQPAAPAQPSAAAPPDQPTQKIEGISVTAQKLKQARIDMEPKVGTTIYTIDSSLIDAMGQGDATPFDEVLLQLPGVDKDSKASGSLHVRDDHANVQYRVNGVTLPENISGFGTSIDSRYVSKIDFITGTIPAQYGLR